MHKLALHALKESPRPYISPEMSGRGLLYLGLGKRAILWGEGSFTLVMGRSSLGRKGSLLQTEVPLTLGAETPSPQRKDSFTTVLGTSYPRSEVRCSA